MDEVSEIGFTTGGDAAAVSVNEEGRPIEKMDYNGKEKKFRRLG